MPSPYVAAGIIGGLALLGFAVWTLFTQNQHYDEHSYGGGYSRTRFNPEPGYDRPRNEEQCDSDSGRRRRNGRKEHCSICQEQLNNGELIRRLPCSCGNRFHDACIIRWFQGFSRRLNNINHSHAAYGYIPQVQRTCPICRTTLQN